MDSNGHRFWLLASDDDFDLSAGGDLATGGLAWGQGCLRLAGEAAAFETGTPRSAALAMADLPPVTIDSFGSWAWFDPSAGEAGEAGAVVAEGSGEGMVRVFGLPEGATLSDQSADEEGVLRLALTTPEGSGLALADLRGRWAQPVFIETTGAAPDRVAEGWLLERSSGRLWTEAGEPIADLAIRAYAGHIFRPHPEYANPPRLAEQDPITLGTNDRIADLAARADGLLAVLVHGSAQSRTSRIVFVTPTGERRSLDLPVRGYPGSIGWISETRLALLYPDVLRALALETGPGLPEALTIAPTRYPLKGTGQRRLCRGSVLPCWIAAYEDDRPLSARPLEPLSLPGYAARGEARASEDIDAGEIGTVWHKLVVEGEFSPGTGAVIELRAADATEALSAASIARHRFGAAATQADAPADMPVGAWIEEPSELPFHPGVLGEAPLRDRRGCFIALVQQGGRVSREVVGRFLRITVRMTGGGQATARIGAIRVYANRFSLTRAYLPPVFHPPADPARRLEEGPAHPRDFFDRFVAGFEGVLTRIEDKVAAAHLLTDPYAAPEEALDWLAGWVGLVMNQGLSIERRRVMLANAMRLHRRRGTMGGLMLALDITSGGRVGEGGIVAFEDFCLRRVFATIIGADLGSRFDPLLGGEVESGNSFVGTTLHVGDAEEIDGEDQPQLSEAQATELRALFRAPADQDDADAVRNFFAELAWRVTVLVHHELDETELNLLREVARQMTPAHVKLRVERASHPLILGLYSLVSIDTHLKPRPGPTAVEVDRTIIGERDFVLRLPSLDPRLESRTLTTGGSP